MPLPSYPVPHAAVRFGLGLRRRVQALADWMMPAEAALWDHLAGMQRARLAGVLVTSGLADAIGTGRHDARELARRLGLSAEVTLRVLGAADAARLVELDSRGRVRMARLGGPLRSDHPRSIAAWAAYQTSAMNLAAYGQLEGQLRGGEQPSGHRLAFGNSIWDYFAEHPDEGARFGEAMRQLTTIDVGALARAYPWPRQGVICDVGGGIGTLLAAILVRRPLARGVLVDAPEVLQDAESFLRAQGVLDRVTRQPGDLFGGIEVQADVYVLKWIMHDWSDQSCAQILGGLAAAMPPGARLVTIDQHLEPNRPNPISSMADLVMLSTCEGGRERSPDHVLRMMQAAGLAPGRVRHAGLHMLVEGIAPAEGRPAP